MTTSDTTRPAQVDPLVLTRRAGAGLHALTFAVDVVGPLSIAAIGIVLIGGPLPGPGWMLVACAVALVAASVRSLSRTGRSLGALAAGTRTVERSSGAAAGSALIPALVSGRLRTVDLRRGRDPFAPALAPLEFPAAAPVAAATAGALRGRTPTLELDSGQRLSLTGALVIGRDPQSNPDAPAQVYQWPDLSRTLSRSHTRLEWDGRTVWATDLGSTNGTMLRTDDEPQPLLPFQRTPLPPGATVELGDRIIAVRTVA